MVIFDRSSQTPMSLVTFVIRRAKLGSLMAQDQGAEAVITQNRSMSSKKASVIILTIVCSSIIVFGFGKLNWPLGVHELTFRVHEED